MSHLRSLKYVIVFQLMVIAIVISLLFLFCMREQIVEQWWIFRLHTGNTRTQLVATSVLSAKHSVRCVPVLLQQIKIHLQHVPLSPCSHSNYIFDPAGGDRSPYTDKLYDAAQLTLITIGKPAVPYIIEGLYDQDPRFARFAAATLGWLWHWCYNQELGTREVFLHRFDRIHALLPVLNALAQAPIETPTIRDAAAKAVVKLMASDDSPYARFLRSAPYIDDSPTHPVEGHND